MTDGITVMIGEDGVAREYDDTYDVIIHCESQKDQDEVKRRLKASQRWVPVTERLPEEDLPVLVAVKQKDRLPTWVEDQTYSYVTGIDAYDNGEWYSHKKKVVAWMPLPEPYKGGEQE